MDNQPMQIQDNDAPSFDIIIDQNCMVQSYVMDKQKIEFPNVDLVVNQHGINKISDSLSQFNTIKVEPNFIKELQIIGKGSQGVVRRAVYKLNGKQYIFAIKSINAAHQDDRKQLLNDLRSYLSEGKSEHLIYCHTCFFHNGLVKQVMEYMDMGALRDIIQLVSAKKLTLSEEQMANIIFKILNGLHYIHDARHQIHRDIKPENILLNTKGDVKITDFRVSKCIKYSIRRAMVENITYMSPQRLLLGQKYTYKCDIWSLGLILYQLATGKSIPYSDLGKKINYYQVCQKIINEQPPQLPPNIFSAEMEDFLKRCLQKQQQQRASAQILLNHPWIVSKANDANLRDLMEKIQLIA